MTLAASRPSVLACRASASRPIAAGCRGRSSTRTRAQYTAVLRRAQSRRAGVVLSLRRHSLRNARVAERIVVHRYGAAPRRCLDRATMLPRRMPRSPGSPMRSIGVSISPGCSPGNRPCCRDGMAARGWIPRSAVGPLLRADAAVPARHRIAYPPDPGRILAGAGAAGRLTFERHSSYVGGTAPIRAPGPPTRGSISAGGGSRGAEHRLVAELGRGHARAQGVLSQPVD